MEGVEWNIKEGVEWNLKEGVRKRPLILLESSEWSHKPVECPGTFSLVIVKCSINT